MNIAGTYLVPAEYELLVKYMEKSAAYEELVKYTMKSAEYDELVGYHWPQEFAEYGELVK